MNQQAIDRVDPKRWEELAALDGLISPEVGQRLAFLAAGVSPVQAIVEIGSYRGKSASYLATGARAGFNAHVFCVDPWDSRGNTTGRFGFAEPQTRQAFFETIRSQTLGDCVTAFRGYSIDVAHIWTKPIGLLYIDGSHTEEDVQADFDAWAPHLAAGAIVAFDDYRTDRNPGVAKVVDRLKRDRRFSGAWEDGPAPLTVGFWGLGNG